jgi:hypothetical protein
MMTTNKTCQAQDSTSVVDFTEALSVASAHETPAALTEALLPGVTESFWLLVSSNALLEATQTQVLSMILRRALPSGVSIALDVDWKPECWGLHLTQHRRLRSSGVSAPGPSRPADSLRSR